MSDQNHLFFSARREFKHFPRIVIISLCLISCGDVDERGRDHSAERMVRTTLSQTFYSEFSQCDGSRANGLMCQDGGCTSILPEVWTNSQCSVIRQAPAQAEIRATNNEWGRTRLRALAAGRPANEKISCHILVKDEVFDFGRFTDASTSLRANLISERLQDLAPAQTAAQAVVASLGGEVKKRTWLVPGLIVQIPTGRVEELIASPAILGVNPSAPGQNQDAWDGDLLTSGILAQELENQGYEGETGGRATASSDNIKIGIAEAGPSGGGAPNFNCTHIGWDDTPSGTSRLIDTDECDDTGCSGSTCSTTGQHATTVAWVAAGSIEQGQDPNFPGTNTLAQRMRSGVAREAELYIYQWRAGETCGLLSALEQAVADGVDVLNISWGGSDCNLSRNDCSANAAFVNAMNSGLVTIASAGNDAPSSADGFCSVNWPAVRSEVMSVSSLNSDPQSLGYDELLMVTSDSYGTAGVSMYPNGVREMSMVDLSAPREVDHYFSGSSSNGYSTTDMVGSSFAAPAVAAVAGLMRDWQSAFGWSLQNDARAIFTNTLVLGDGYDGTSTAASKLFITVSNRTGFGRLRAHWPSSLSLGDPFSWGSWDRTISNGETNYLVVPGNPQSALKTGVKIAVGYFDEDYADISDITVQLVNTCPVGGGEVVLRTAARAPLRKKIRYTDISGKCLAVKIIGTAVESTEHVNVVAYTYSNSGDLH